MVSKILWLAQNKSLMDTYLNSCLLHDKKRNPKYKDYFLCNYLQFRSNRHILKSKPGRGWDNLLYDTDLRGIKENKYCCQYWESKRVYLKSYLDQSYFYRLGIVKETAQYKFDIQDCKVDKYYQTVGYKFRSNTPVHIYFIKDIISTPF